jgi:DNA (cytosine-5)-methyltransferase 1
VGAVILVALSLFSGIGGIDLGLERAGWRIVGQAERDPYRRAVLAARFPGVPAAVDVREVAAGGGGGRARLDLICGGFPCQDLSLAGRRAGLAGERSGLFWEFARIAAALRPRALLLENVPGLLTSNGGRDFGCVLDALARLGYGLGWRILDSRFFGVPQRRRRLFLLGLDAPGRAGAGRAGEVLAVASRCEGHPAAGGGAAPGATGGVADGAGVYAGSADEEGVAAPLESLTGGQRTSDIEGATWVLEPPAALAYSIVPEGGQGARLRAAEVDQANTLDSLNAQQHDRGTRLVEGQRVRRLTPLECERLQGFPDGWTQVRWQGRPAPDTRRYAACGDAVTVPVAEWLGRRLAGALAGGGA